MNKEQEQNERGEKLIPINSPEYRKAVKQARKILSQRSATRAERDKARIHNIWGWKKT